MPALPRPAPPEQMPSAQSPSQPQSGWPASRSLPRSGRRSRAPSASSCPCCLPGLHGDRCRMRLRQRRCSRRCFLARRCPRDGTSRAMARRLQLTRLALPERHRHLRLAPQARRRAIGTSTLRRSRSLGHGCAAARSRRVAWSTGRLRAFAPPTPRCTARSRSSSRQLAQRRMRAMPRRAPGAGAVRCMASPMG